MKKILSLLAVILFTAIGAFSQSPAPGIFNYQGVARNSVGNVLINQSINLRLTIHDGTPGGAVVYQESRGTTTNPFGLFNVQVGSAGGTNVTGTIAGVPWGVGDKYIQVEIDPAGGTSFINIGTARIASVPYSLYSSLSNDLVLPFNKTQANAGTLFTITNSGTGGSIMGVTQSGAGNIWGVQGQVNNAAAGAFSAGVLGTNTGTGGNGIGVMGTQNGSGWGVYGTTPSGIGVIGASTSGIGGRFTSTSGQALYTTGGVRLQGINEAANRILATVPGDGTATWQSPSILGIVTGSGTVNFVPKWTPTTTNLGNSIIFDNGTQVGINTITPGYRLQVVHGGSDGISSRSTAGFSVSDVDASNGDAALRFLSGGTFRWNIRNDPAGNDLQFFDMGAGLARMRLLTANGNLGINTGAPAYRLDVDATNAGSSNGIRVRHNSSFATVDVVGVSTDQAFRFGKNGSVYSGINTLPDGDHINFFKFGAGQNLMSLNVNTGNLGVGGPGINGVGKVHVRGFNTTNNLYSSSTGFLGATGIVSNDVTAQPTNEKWGIHTFVNGGVGTQHAIFAEPGTTGAVNTGLFGRVSTAPAAGSSFALFAFDPVNTASTWAATIRGRLQYQDGSQGLGKILRSTDATGNASWSTLAAAGIVAGSGTLNYVPKWTPDGVTLGNSQIFDDGTNVGIGTTTPLQTLQVSKFPVNPAMGGQLMLENAGVPFPTNTVAIDFVPIGYAFSSNIPGARLTAFDDGLFSSHLIFSTKTPGASGNPLAERMRISSAGNVGIGTNTPVALLHVDNTGVGTGSVRVNQPNEVSIPAVKSLSGGVITNDASAVFPGLLGTNSIYAQRGDLTGGTLTVSILNETGVVGLSPTGTGVQGISVTGRGVVAFATNGVGLRAFSQTGQAILVNSTTGQAINSTGAIQLTGIGETNGAVLTSDAVGNATWQGFGGISLRTFTSDLTIPSGVDVPITQWSSIEYESGGSNYNPLTGEYTIPVTGIYQIACNITWYPFATSGAALTTVKLFVNGGFAYQITSDNSTASYNTTTLNLTQSYVAGTVISIQVAQNSGVNQALPGFPYSASSLSINMLHK